MNKKDDVHGIVVNLPLPDHLKPFTNEILDHIDERKDLDCVNKLNYYKMLTGYGGLNSSKLKNIQHKIFFPGTALATYKILDSFRVPLEGKKAIIVGSSYHVGYPISKMLQ